MRVPILVAVVHVPRTMIVEIVPCAHDPISKPLALDVLQFSWGCIPVTCVLTAASVVRLATVLTSTVSARAQRQRVRS
jgi:hypothetical protein